MRSLRSQFALLAALALAACGGASSTPGVGTVTLAFELGSADVTSADYEISAADLSPSLTGALTVTGAHAGGTVVDVPAGTGRTVTVRAYSGSGAAKVQRCSGSTSVTVTAGATVAATLLLTCNDELGEISVAATFDPARTPDSASATVSGAGIGSPIVVPLQLGGGTVTGLVRSVPAGTNRSVTVSTVRNGTVECTGMGTVTVTAGATVPVSGLILTCSSPAPTTGSITVNGQVNFTPRIHGVTLSQPGVLPGGTVTASVVASDGDGDPLAYAWTLNGAASNLFGSPSAAATNFTATSLAAGSYTLTVTVSDGVTPPVSGSVQLVVGSGAAIGWCNLQSPSAPQAVALGGSLDVYGQFYISGATNAPGAAPGVLAQAGYGPANADASTTPGAFTWVPAAYNVDVGNNDEYRAQLSPPAAGSYRFAFRYSTNGGAAWTYGDLDGLSNGFDPAQQGQLTVN